jgi:RimJ/RimL family protein N-acetyltransferase
MKTIVFDKERVSKFVIGLTGGSLHFGTYHAIGVEQDGEMIGGIVYDGFVNGARCFMHCAGLERKWLTKRLLWMAFDYPFNQLGMKTVISPVSSKNDGCIRFIKHLGFTESARIKDGYKDADLLIFSLHKDDSKWGALNVT